MIATQTNILHSRRVLYGRGLDDDADIPEPPSPTGQYPDPIWAEDSVVTLALDSDADIPEPPSPTGQYPGPIWIEDEIDATGVEQALEDSAIPVQPETQDLPLFSLKDFSYDDVIGEAEDDISNPARPALATLDTQAMYRIIREVALGWSGKELYTAISADSEYRSPAHLAYGRRHFGLGFGLLLFTQESGRLGAVLRLMQRRDPAAFTTLFGAASEELLSVTNATTAQERLGPVGGELLWSAGWIERFRQAGALPAFQAAQNEEAIEGLFRPMLRIAFGLGLVSDRALAIVYDQVIARGLGSGLRWVVSAAAVLRTDTQRMSALRLIGANDVLAFQSNVPGLARNGRFGPETHAALVEVLRTQHLMPLPTLSELMTRLIESADETTRTRLIKLRDTRALYDVVYAE